MPKIPEVHLIDYLQVIKRRKWIIVACLFVTLTIVTIGNYIIEPVYQATVQLIIDKEQRESPVTGEMMERESYQSEPLTFHTHIALIDSFPVLSRVVETLPDRKRGEGEIHSQVDALRMKISIEPVRDTRLVNINVQDSDPVFARDTANAIANIYIDYTRTSRFEAARASVVWFNEQLKDIEQSVRESERRFYEFRDKEKIFSIKGKQDIDTQGIRELNTSYNDTKSKRLETEARIKELKKFLDQDSGEKFNPTIVQNPALQNLYAELLKAEIELSNLRKTFMWKHPKIQGMNSKIQEIKEKFDQELKRTLNNLQAEYNVLIDRERALLAAIGRYEAEVLNLNKKEMQYVMLEREVETNKELHNILLTKFKEANIIEDMDMNNIRLVEVAATPRIPIKPRKALNLILGTVIGLIMGTFLSFFLEYLDRSIKTPEEVNRYLGLPVLAAIPKVKK
jgi:uncharacterized protein involved in exopolysaccharide biosynthesis